jgi:pimeloyl-ACP methyl ester carboxylesterase
LNKPTSEIVNIPLDGWTLHGIVHLPQHASGRRVGVVLFHENFNTKIGTHRLFRDLGDRLAQAGFYALRYDDRGMCDSPGVCDLTIADRLADARAAASFFRSQYKLDTVVGWGLCLGAAIAVHTSSSRNPSEKLDGLILCSIVADPGIVSLPQFGYERVQISKVAQEFFLRGNVLRKLLNAPRRLKPWAKKFAVLARRYLRPTPRELGRMKDTIGRVGGLLARYDGPSILVFGEKDSYLTDFVERVNPNDRLGLKKKELPPSWVLIKDGDHTFSSREKTEELFSLTLSWMQPFLEGSLPGQFERAQAGNVGVSAGQAVGLNNSPALGP